MLPTQLLKITGIHVIIKIVNNKRAVRDLRNFVHLKGFQDVAK